VRVLEVIECRIQAIGQRRFAGRAFARQSQRGDQVSDRGKHGLLLARLNAESIVLCWCALDVKGHAIDLDLIAVFVRQTLFVGHGAIRVLGIHGIRRHWRRGCADGELDLVFRAGQCIAVHDRTGRDQCSPGIVGPGLGLERPIACGDRFKNGATRCRQRQLARIADLQLTHALVTLIGGAAWRACERLSGGLVAREQIAARTVGGIGHAQQVGQPAFEFGGQLLAIARQHRGITS
jgi:hypothetical protein